MNRQNHGFPPLYTVDEIPRRNWLLTVAVILLLVILVVLLLSVVVLVVEVLVLVRVVLDETLIQNNGTKFTLSNVSNISSMRY